MQASPDFDERWQRCDIAYVQMPARARPFARLDICVAAV